MGKVIDFFEAKNRILARRQTRVQMPGIDIEEWILQNFPVSELVLNEDGKFISVPVSSGGNDKKTRK